jgi:2-dehydro-3-deoxy-D-arabinonate dehydratase
MKLYRTNRGVRVERGGASALMRGTEWDVLVGQVDPAAWVRGQLASLRSSESPGLAEGERVLAPIGEQEVWAAGVTYLRSKQARMDESESAGGGDFYDRVYAADRPELFFKASSHRVAGPGDPVRIRRDSKWNVPEPELALLVNPRGRIVGYTIGNDMSSRDIEGENPLYLPQAKVYDGCCALGPAVLLADEPLPGSTEIRLRILRFGAEAFAGRTSLSQMKRDPQELVDWLFRESTFPNGCYLLTGTGVVPPDSFTLQAGDEIEITIDPIGTLRNAVAPA